MNETVIQEIANQLGIATDKAADFIQTYLPQYATLNVIQNVIGLSVLAIVIIVFSIFLYCAYRHYAARYVKRYGEKCYFFKYVDESLGAFIALIVLYTMIAFFGFCIAFVIPDTIGWIMYPEAQLISDCMYAIKQ